MNDEQKRQEELGLAEDGLSQGPEEAAALPVEPEPPQVEEPLLPDQDQPGAGLDAGAGPDAGAADSAPEPAAEEPAPGQAAPAGPAAGGPAPQGAYFPPYAPDPHFVLPAYGSAGQPGAAGYPPPQPVYGQAYAPYPYPPQGYPAYPPQPYAQGAAPAYPGAGAQPAGGPLPASPAESAPQPGAGGPYPPYPYYAGAKPPQKKKRSWGMVLFLCLAGLLALGTVVGASVYFGVHMSGSGPRPYEIPEEPPAQSQEEAEPSATPLPTPDVDVTPNTEGIAIHSRPAGPQLDAEAVYDRVVVSTVSISATLERDGQTGESSGTGIIATSDGYIITNSHVVLNSKSTRVTVTAYDGQEYDAVVVGVDRTTDLAVLKTNDYGFTPAEFGNAAELSVGEWVLAIGNPGGDRFSSSLTRGIISGLDREVGKYSENGMTYIQTDAAINPGNSGGPLVNLYGQVVGINSSKIVTEGYEGMGFAIPVSRAHPIINELLSGGYIKGRTRLGIMCREINSATSALNGIPRGLLIQSVNEESAFAGTEAQEGDIIVAIEGKTVENLRDVSNLLLSYAPGDKVSVTLYRPALNPLAEGEEIEVTATLLEDNGETQE